MQGFLGRIGTAGVEVIGAAVWAALGLWVLGRRDDMERELLEELERSKKASGILARLNTQHLEFLSRDYRRRLWWMGVGSLAVAGAITIHALLVVVGVIPDPGP